jgi:hypothetical protein
VNENGKMRPVEIFTSMGERWKKNDGGVEFNSDMLYVCL